VGLSISATGLIAMLRSTARRAIAKAITTGT